MTTNVVPVRCSTHSLMKFLIPVPQPVFFVRTLVFLALGLFGTACSGAQSTHVAAGSSGVAEITAAKGTSGPTKTQASTPSCPPAGLLPLQSLPDTGHHKVTLSWNASAASPKHSGDAVGYCLYRSKKEYAAKKNPTCSVCEQINSVPISSLSCIDNQVEDSTTYYYVVTAINPASRISSSSNEVTASVPPRDKPGSQRSASQAPPLCRVSSAGK